MTPAQRFMFIATFAYVLAACNTYTDAAMRVELLAPTEPLERRIVCLESRAIFCASVWPLYWIVVVTGKIIA